MGFFSGLAKVVGSGVLPRSVTKKFLPDSVERAIYGPSNVGQATAVAAPAPSRQNAVETPTSGNITVGQASAPMPFVQPAQAFTGLLPQIAQRAPQIGRTIRDVAVGVGATSFLGGDSEGMGLFNVRVNERGTLVGLSRKEQRQAKQLVELVGFEQAADMIGVDDQIMAMILLKKFSQGGKGITAAQLRNAQRVNNRIVHMHKALEQSFKKSTTAARRRTTGTRVTQIKN
jgi:hypothetical protein